MLDGVTLDQLRIFIAAAECGSFSAAARRLNRAQSAVSQALAKLEAQLGVALFDRAGRAPALTGCGVSLLADARRAVAGMNDFRARARSLAGGLEAEVSVVVDVMFPIAVLTASVAGFQVQFPATPLRLYVEALGAVVKPVLEGKCGFGIMGSLPIAPEGLTVERLRGVRLAMVAGGTHPLARHAGPIPSRVLAQHVQLVLTDRSALSQGREFGVMSARTWRLADLGAKHAFLRAGLGWGSMPLDAIEADIASGALVFLKLEAPAPDGFVMPMSAAFPVASPPGPAGRWLIEQLKEGRG